jgi:glycosyltransferase involved in cell wall biosynthesis
LSQILFVTSFHPGASGQIGAGEAICGDSLRRLRAAGNEVHVLAFAPRSQAANAEVVGLCASYQIVDHSPLDAVLAVLFGFRWGSLRAPWLFSRVSPRNIRCFATALREIAFDEIWIDFPSSLGFAAHAKDRPITYFVHDVVAQRVGRSPLLSRVFPAVEGVEGRLIALARRAVTLSEKDAALLRKMGYRGDIDVAPPTAVQVGSVDGAMPVASLLDHFDGKKNIVFFGNMKRAENHWSILHFLLFAYPRIRRIHPDIHFWILGLSPRWLLRLVGWVLPGVHVVGAVDDPTPAFRAASICVAPLRLGAGVKIKVLQMLEAGATVIASPVGGEGISESPNLFVVPYDDIAGEICRRLPSIPQTA